jgi:hypothetical protein
MHQGQCKVTRSLHKTGGALRDSSVLLTGRAESRRRIPLGARHNGERLRLGWQRRWRVVLSLWRWWRQLLCREPYVRGKVCFRLAWGRYNSLGHGEVNALSTTQQRHITQTSLLHASLLRSVLFVL